MGGIPFFTCLASWNNNTVASTDLDSGSVVVLTGLSNQNDSWPLPPPSKEKRGEEEIKEIDEFRTN